MERKLLDSLVRVVVGLVVSGIIFLVFVSAASGLGNSSRCAIPQTSSSTAGLIYNIASDDLNSISIGFNGTDGDRAGLFIDSSMVDKIIDNITLSLNTQNIENDPGDLYIRVRNSDDNIVITLATVDAGTLTNGTEDQTNYTWESFTFDDFTLRAGYVITLEYSGEGWVNVEVDTDGDASDATTQVYNGGWGPFIDNSAAEMVAQITSVEGTVDATIINQNCQEAQGSTWNAISIIPYVMIVSGVLLFVVGKSGRI